MFFFFHSPNSYDFRPYLDHIVYTDNVFKYCEFCHVSRMYLYFPFLFVINLDLITFLGNSLVEEENKEQVEVQDAPHSITQAAAEDEHPKEEAGGDACLDNVDYTQEDVLHNSRQNKEQQASDQNKTDQEANELESQVKQEEEDQVETFFSSMSHRYEEPLPLWARDKSHIDLFKYT